MDDVDRRFQAAQLREQLPIPLSGPLFRYARGSGTFEDALLEVLQGAAVHAQKQKAVLADMQDRLAEIRESLAGIATQVRALARHGAEVEAQYNALHTLAAQACGRIPEAFEAGKEASWGPVICPEIPGPLPRRLVVPARDDLLTTETLEAEPEEVRVRPHRSLIESARESNREPTAAEIGWEVLHEIARTRQRAGESADDD